MPVAQVIQIATRRGFSERVGKLQVHTRLVKTEYLGGHGDRVSRSLTIEGAMKAALLRIAHGQYTEARVYDERFGEYGSTLSLTIKRFANGIAIEWSKEPKWRYEQ